MAPAPRAISLRTCLSANNPQNIFLSFRPRQKGRHPGSNSINHGLPHNRGIVASNLPTFKNRRNNYDAAPPCHVNIINEIINERLDTLNVRAARLLSSSVAVGGVRVSVIHVAVDLKIQQRKTAYPGRMYIISMCAQLRMRR